MTDAKRHLAIKALIKQHTKAHSVSKSAARAVLIKEGIYTEKGDLRPEFGGPKQKVTSAA